MGMFDNQNQDTQNQTAQNDFNSVPAAQDNYGSPFDRIGDSKPNEGGVYPEPGVYPLLGVNVLKMIKSRKGDDIFIAEFDIIQSEVEDRPAGTCMSWVGNFKYDAVPGNVRMLLAAIMGVPVNDVDAAGSQFAVSVKNPCRGRLVRLSATTITTKSGNPFTLCKFSAIDEETQKDSEQLRKSAGFDGGVNI